jgi:formylglycine-generating enzyme
MGDAFGDPEAGSNEKPAHAVILSDFYLSKHELTFEEFDAFCTATGREKPADQGWGRGRWPVINLDWYDAVEYCNWRSRKENLPEAYRIDKNTKDPNNTNTSDDKKWTVEWIASAKGYRLPTEAEWEYAAREGGKKVRFGNGRDVADPSEINFNGSSEYKKSYSVAGLYRQKTVPADELPVNALGLKHLSGNVWEWCWDWYAGDFYANSVGARNPQGPSAGSDRVVRGGSWFHYPQVARAADRGAIGPVRRGHVAGFRLARTR